MSVLFPNGIIAIAIDIKIFQPTVKKDLATH